MDRKGWIILILCGIGMMLSFNSWKQGAENSAKLAEQERERKEAKLEQTKQAEQGKEGTREASATTPTEVAAATPEQLKEKEYVLTTTTAEGDIVKYTFTNKGGGVKTAELLKESKDLDGKYVLINRFGKHPIGALAEDEGEFANITYPSDKVVKLDRSITFTHRLKSGLNIVKTWSLEDDDVPSHQYRLKLQITVENFADTPVKLKRYAVTTGITAPLFQEESPALSKWFYYQDGDYESGDSGPFTEGWFGWGEAKDVDVHSVQNLEFVGVSNQFYTTILLPESPSKKIWVDDTMVELSDGADELRSYVAAVTLPDHDLLKGVGPQTYTYSFYTGPRKQSELSKLSANSEDAMSYGVFGIGAPWANIALNWIHDTMGTFIHVGYSWGIAIVILTIFIRILIWPLHNKSTRTMKRMSKLAPIMKEIREKHSDNPQKVQQETLKLYKKYKVNPMGGCLPILVQMPIFFAVFGMLTNAVELRGQGFLWVKDLSQQEDIWTIPFIDLPLNILPITMALTMILQMKMTPSTGDKMQRRIFMLMPILFFVFCYSYAAALALYWTVQNIVSIGQTWLMKRLPEPELVEAKEDSSKPRKKGFMERMSEKVEEAQKQREAAMAAKTGRPAPKEKKQPQVPGQKPDKDKKRSPKTGG